MDVQRFGAAIRAARIRRGWRQVDLAGSASVSRGTISRIERGLIDDVAFGTLGRVGAALGVRVELLTRSRGADLDRLLNAKHAALAEAAIAWLRRDAWVVRPEVSFSIWGERGIIDLLAWHPGRRALLVIELKTDVVDIGELLGTFDRKLRLGATVAASLGWQVDTVSACLIVAEGMSNRRRVLAHGATFRAALPDDARRVRSWLRDPAGEVRGLVFLSDARPGSVRTGFATTRRVANRHATPTSAERRSPEHDLSALR